MNPRDPRPQPPPEYPHSPVPCRSPLAAKAKSPAGTMPLSENSEHASPKSSGPSSRSARESRNSLTLNSAAQWPATSHCRNAQASCGVSHSSRQSPANDSRSNPPRYQSTQSQSAPLRPCGSRRSHPDMDRSERKSPEASPRAIPAPSPQLPRYHLAQVHFFEPPETTPVTSRPLGSPPRKRTPATARPTHQTIDSLTPCEAHWHKPHCHAPQESTSTNCPMKKRSSPLESLSRF